MRNAVASHQGSAAYTPRLPCPISLKFEVGGQEDPEEPRCNTRPQAAVQLKSHSRIQKHFADVAATTAASNALLLLTSNRNTIFQDCCRGGDCER
jgi:hypothetical protein